jgi:hypothetical protein
MSPGSDPGEDGSQLSVQELLGGFGVKLSETAQKIGSAVRVDNGRKKGRKIQSVKLRQSKLQLVLGEGIYLNQVLQYQNSQGTYLNQVLQYQNSPSLRNFKVGLFLSHLYIDG